MSGTSLPASFSTYFLKKKFLLLYSINWPSFKDNKTLYNFKISRKDINYVGQLFKCDGKPKLWEELKNEFNLQDQLQFTYNQIIHSIPKSWKDAFIVNSENIKNLVFEGHHLIKNHQIYCLNKLSSKEIYNILIESTDSKPSTQIYYKIFFQNSNILMGKLLLTIIIIIIIIILSFSYTTECHLRSRSYRPFRLLFIN